MTIFYKKIAKIALRLGVPPQDIHDMLIWTNLGSSPSWQKPGCAPAIRVGLFVVSGWQAGCDR